MVYYSPFATPLLLALLLINADGHAGINAVELDTQDQYFVGLGGLPNSEGTMEMDAAVMDGKTMTYGAVMAIRYFLPLQHQIVHPRNISSYN